MKKILQEKMKWEILNKPMDKKLIFKLINRLFLLDIAVKIFGKNK